MDLLFSHLYCASWPDGMLPLTLAAVTHCTSCFSDGFPRVCGSLPRNDCHLALGAQEGFEKLPRLGKCEFRSVRLNGVCLCSILEGSLFPNGTVSCILNSHSALAMQQYSLLYSY